MWVNIEVDFINRVSRDSVEDLPRPMVGIDVIDFAGTQQGVNHCCSANCVVRADKPVVFCARCNERNDLSLPILEVGE